MRDETWRSADSSAKWTRYGHGNFELSRGDPLQRYVLGRKNLSTKKKKKKM